jgi:hypothetical protein
MLSGRHLHRPCQHDSGALDKDDRPTCGAIARRDDLGPIVGRVDIGSGKRDALAPEMLGQGRSLVLSRVADKDLGPPPRP